jgi:predicted enzyme related to lactoylglutathione lyase
MTDYIEEVAAVLFTTNVARLASFYEHVIGMERRVAHDNHVVLEQGVFRLTVHGIPERYAKGIAITTPPAVRETSALKLSFKVDSIAATRDAASRHGGCIYAPDREWHVGKKSQCDGWDPDGNVFQVFAVGKD